MKPLEILLVEDDPEDILLTKEAFSDEASRIRFQVAHDGEQALQYLRRLGPFSQAARPDLILLDLNLPRKDGREVLAEIKGDPSLRSIPVIVLTTSNFSRDILQAYDLHANCYVTKPAGLSRLKEFARTIKAFWMELAQLPPAP